MDGRELVDKRHQYGLTQRALADQLGITVSTLGKIETGKEPVPADLYRKATDLFARIQAERASRQSSEAAQAKQAIKTAYAFANFESPSTLAELIAPVVQRYHLKPEQLADKLPLAVEAFNQALQDPIDDDLLAQLAGIVARASPDSAAAIVTAKYTAAQETLETRLLCTLLDHMGGYRRAKFLGDTYIQLHPPEWLRYTAELPARYPRWSQAVRGAYPPPDKYDYQQELQVGEALGFELEQIYAYGYLAYRPLRYDWLSPAQMTFAQRLVQAILHEPHADLSGHDSFDLLQLLAAPILASPRTAEFRNATAELKMLLAGARYPAFTTRWIRPARQLLVLSAASDWYRDWRDEGHELPTLYSSDRTDFKIVRNALAAGQLPPTFDLFFIDDTFGLVQHNVPPDPLPAELTGDTLAFWAAVSFLLEKQAASQPYETAFLRLSEAHLSTILANRGWFSDLDLHIVQGPSGTQYKALRNWLDVVIGPGQPSHADLVKQAEAKAKLKIQASPEEVAALAKELRKARKKPRRRY